jgi:hypothetical protein
MGDYVNGNAANILGWLTAALMAAEAIAWPPEESAPDQSASSSGTRRSLPCVGISGGWHPWLHARQLRSFPVVSGPRAEFVLTQ